MQRIKKFLAIFVACLALLLPATALATTAVPWSITNLTDGFIFPNLVNGSAKGILVSASSTFNGNLSVSTLTNGDCVQAGVGGILVSASSACGSGSGSTFGTTSISATSPLIWNTSTANMSIQVANTSQSGYLTSTDWNTFNGKQAAGNYLTALTGDGTASGPGSAAFTLATVNSNIGTFNNVTVNAKGLVTAASNVAYDTFAYPFPSNATTSALTLGGLTLSNVTGTTQCLHVNSSGVISGTATDCGSSGGSVTAVTASNPLFSSGGTAPNISTIFSTTSTFGLGNNGFLVFGPTGIPFSAASSTLNLPNTALQNSSLTVNGTSISLGGSGTVTANTTNAVTFNSSGSGGSSPQVFNGSSAETISYNTIGAQPTIALGAGTINSTAGNVLYATATSTPTVTAPITYSGTLGQFIGGVSGTFACTSASAGVTGCLTGTDWSTFNGKQPAGNYITALTGDVTASGPGSVAATLATVNSNVGTFTYPSVTVNGKGLITAISNGTAPTTYTGTFPIQVTGSVISSLFSTTSNSGMAQGFQYIGSGGIFQSAASSSLFGFTPQPAGNYLTALTGDGTASGPGSAALTLATVNGNVGSFTNANITVNGKGLITAASNGTVSAGGIATTSLAATAPITLTVSSASATFGTSFSTSTFNAFSAENTFTNLFATNASSTNATTTNLALTGGAANCNGTSALTTNSSGVVGCTAQPQGTVTAVSVASSNGFAGSSSGGATPTLTLTTTITGILKGNGTAITAATPGTDYDVFAWPFTPVSYGNATGTLIGFTGGILSIGSTTIVGNATTTGMHAFGNVRIPSLGVAAGQFAAFDANGVLIGTTTPINTGGSSEGVQWATAAVLGGTPTYSNGTAGVGATLTEVGTGALAVDGNSPASGDRVLVKNQASAFQNGIYTVTVTGSGIASYVLTRSSDYNSNTEITPGLTTYVVSGTANLDTNWAVNFTVPLTMGTTNLNYTEVSGGGAAVTSVSNSDSTLTITPTTGNVVGSLNLAHANVWSALQTFGNATSSLFSTTYGSTTNAFIGTLTLPGITGTQCLHSVSGVVSGTGSDCGSGGGGAAYPFFPSTDGGINTSATSTPVQGTNPGLGLDVSATSWYGIGGQLLAYASTTNNSVVFGLQAGGQQATTSSSSINGETAIGVGALQSLSNGVRNTAVGNFAGNALTTGTQNVAVGGSALTTAVSGGSNAAFGYGALQQYTGSSNSAFGFQALTQNSNGAFNAAFGAGSLSGITTGTQNVAFGYHSFTTANTNSNNNTSIGYLTGPQGTGYAAIQNTLVGSQAGASLIAGGNDNTLIGTYSGANMTSGYGNTLIGLTFNPTSITTGHNNINLGGEVFNVNVAGNNQLNIGNLIYGTLPATTSVFQLPITGSIGIGSSTPFAKFAIHTNNGDTATTLFAIGSSTQTATSTLFSIGNTGATSIFTPTNITNAFGVFNAAGSNVFNIDTTATSPQLLVGTTTAPTSWLSDLFNTTGPQLVLSSTASHWSFNNIFGNLFLATSSASTFATSTNSDPNTGFIEFPNNGGCVGCTDIVLASGINLRNAKYISASTTALVANQYNDIYTAPPGRRAFVTNLNDIQNTGSSISVQPALKSGGVYNRMAATSSAVSGLANSITTAIVLEPGESISIISASASINFWANIIEYDASVPFFSPRIINESATTTLYTSPANGGGSSMYGPATTIVLSGNGAIYNGSASTVVNTAFHVKAGQSGAINGVNQTTPNGGNSSVATGSGNFVFTANTSPLFLSPGDSLVVAPVSNPGNGVFIWANIAEH